jgi:hypothetical protein
VDAATLSIFAETGIEKENIIIKISIKDRYFFIHLSPHII